MIVDTPTERTRFQETTLLEQEAFLEGIRERRLKALQVYQELQAEKQRVRDINLSVKAGKILLRMEAKATAIEKHISDYEKMMKDARSMMILIGGAQ
jgi:phosphosulfolactate synthase (CoM biosynthesis protein A)